MVHHSSKEAYGAHGVHAHGSTWWSGAVYPYVLCRTFIKESIINNNLESKN
jgi:hypothetical protein